MTRVQRRLTWQRGRRPVRVDTSVFALEQAPRARAARAVAARIRQGLPVVLRHQRWAADKELLEDIALELGVSDRAVRSSVVNLESLSIRDDPQGWSLLLEDLLAAMGMRSPSARMPLTDRAFSDALVVALHKVAAKGPRALLMRGATKLPVQALERVVAAYDEHGLTTPDEPVALVLAGSSDTRVLPKDHAEVVLHDLTVAEGILSLVEQGSDLPREQMRRLVWMVGGVPAWVERIAGARGPLDPPDWRRILGTDFIHLRSAIALARANDDMARRLDTLSGLEPVDWMDDIDDALAGSGLVRRVGPPSAPKAQLRAPLVAKVDRALTAN